MNTLSKTILSWVVAGVVVAGTMVGCQDPDYATPTPATGPATSTARALFVNASPNAPALNFLVENVSVVQSLTSGQSSTYASIPTGNIQLRVRAATGAIGGTLGSNDVLFRAGATNQNNFGAIAGTNYTIFVTDTIQRPIPTTPAGVTNPGGPQLLVVTDNLTAPAAGNAHVRFFHLAPDVTPVSVRLVATAPASVTVAPTFLNRAYRVTSVGSGTAITNYANFTPVPAATYTAQVFTSATISATSVAALTVPNVVLADGKIYTLYARGLRRNSTLGAGVVQHN